METIAFARGVPAPEMIPVDDIQAASEQVLSTDPVRILSYGTGGGYQPLREQVAEWHGVAPDRVILTPGSLQGLALLIQHLQLASTPGKAVRVTVENPTYDRPLILFDRAGFEVESVRIDDEGIDVAELADLLERTRPQLLYVIPTFQNPAGSTLSRQRRTALVEAARRTGTLVLEDDPYGRLHFTESAPPTLFSQAGDAQVIYSSSFSKLVAPGLRVGYMVVPESLAARLTQLANDTYISPTLLGEAIVSRLIEAGRLDPAVERARSMLGSRCDALCAALDAHLPAATFTRPGGGYFLWADLGQCGCTNTGALLDVAARAGVSFVPGSAFGPGNDSAVRLAFSSPPSGLIEEGVRRLASAIEAPLAARR